MSLTVGQLAKLTGLTVRALHHYDAVGLLMPSLRSDAGYRLYTQADVTRLYRIQALQRLGLSLADIAAALDHDAMSVSQLVAQQLAELDERIEQSTRLRAQLVYLQEKLLQDAAPAMGDWLAALELIATYDQYCSTEEVARLIEHNNDSAWPPFIRDARAAMQRNVEPRGAEARELALRWTRLCTSRFGGDMSLAKKMKLAYLHEPGLQARIQAQSGFDKSMMEFLNQITTQALLGCLERHLRQEDVHRLSLTEEWGREWLAVVASLRSALQRQLETTTDDARQLLARWDACLFRLSSADPVVHAVVAKALRHDAELQEFWAVDAQLLGYVEQLRQMNP